MFEIKYKNDWRNAWNDLTNLMKNDCKENFEIVLWAAEI